MKKNTGLISLCLLALAIGCKEDKLDVTPSPTPQETVPQPDAPVIELEAGEDCISVSWTGVEGADSYEVEYCLASSPSYARAGITHEDSFEIRNLEAETAYKVRVRASAEGALSYWSNVASAVTGKEVFHYPLTIVRADKFARWISSHASECTATDVVSLGGDIDLSGLAVSPASSFAGIFDGAGHSISNLTASGPLFCNNSGTIRNLVLDETCRFSADAAHFNIFGTIANENKGSMESCENHASVSFSVATATFEGGILVGGLVGKSSGPLSKCRNYGNLEMNAKGLSGTMVAGIAAYSSANVSECENHGRVSLVFTHTTDKTDYDYIPLAVNTLVPGVAGVVGITKGASVLKCNNYGDILYKDSAIDKQTGAKGRHQVGGIVSSPDGDIQECTNEGSITICSWTTDRSAGTDVNHEDLICIGGIAGGRCHAAGQNTGSVSDCHNKGAISLDFDSAVSNTAVGGIMGWPGAESQNPPAVIENCSNTGGITVSGSGKGRFGGLTGGTGRVVNCSSKADITVNSTNSGSVAALGMAFHSQAHDANGLTLEGTITANTAMAGIGGLFGNQGNVEESGKTYGNDIDVTLVFGSETTKYGLIIGLYNSGNKNVVTGTAAKPVRVRGSVNGTAVTSANYSSFLCHGGVAEPYKSVNAAFWEK